MAQFLYEVTFRGKSDGTISGCHVMYGATVDINGQSQEAIGAAQPVTGEDVQLVVGEICTAQAETIAQKDAEIAALQAQIAALQGGE